MQLVRGSCCSGDLYLGNLVTDLMGLWVMMVHGLRLCCWCRLEERVVRLELHDLELRRGRLGRLDSDWRGYRHWSRYIGGLRNASGQARIGGCKEVLLLRRVAQFFVLGGGQLLGQQGLLDSWRSGLLLHAIGDG